MKRTCCVGSLVVLAALGCQSTSDLDWQPIETIDLGMLVTEDLTEQVWGTRYVRERGFDKPNVFVQTRADLYGGWLTLQNGYYTVFNHGGPHVDAPNHVGLDGGIDSFAVNAFSGPVKVVDVRGFPNGRTIPPDPFIDLGLGPGDIVIIFTGYTQPPPDSLPTGITLTRDAAEFLAQVPIRAFGTDARSVASLDDPDPRTVEADGRSRLERSAPVHHAFLSRGIPIYEQLANVESLLGRERMFFTGVPLNIRGGDGMIVRPVVFAY